MLVISPTPTIQHLELGTEFGRDLSPHEEKSIPTDLVLNPLN